MDFRKQTDFDKMHISDAVLTTLSNMFDKAASATKPILCVCYSGQTASYAHMLLRMKQYDAYVLKFGMSIYDASLDKWTANCSNAYASDFVKTASPALPDFGDPTLSTGKKEAAAILDARIDEAVSAWAAGMLVAASAVVPNASSFNIMNYWSETDYTTIGHIDGSFQLSPKTLKTTGNLNVFDPAGGNILYCWTGQTAAASIAYLKVLGYDVKSIKFGANAMIYDELPGHKWPKP
jgi:rhodanese-related sulfurtransferase